MKKIVISHNDAKHSIPWSIYYTIEMLEKEGVKLEELNEEYRITYFICHYLTNIPYYGIGDLLFKSKGDKYIIETVIKGLKLIGATSHLEYVIQQKKIIETIPQDVIKKWSDLYPSYGLISKKLLNKLRGKDYKKVSEEEDIDALLSLWLKSLPHFEVVSFKEKYDYLSKIANRPLMNISDLSLKAHAFLLEWDGKKKFFDLNRFCYLEVNGEIERINKYDYFPDAKEKDIDKHIESLYGFGVDGAGGCFLLWHYPDMKKEPPVIYFSSEGEYVFLAQSFNDYILTLPTEDYANLQTLMQEIKKGENLEDIYLIEIACDDYEDEYEKEITFKKMASLLLKDMQTYLQNAELKFQPTDYNLYKKEKKRFNKLLKKLTN